MKVKVGDRIYDGTKELVMVILTEEDRRNIAKMRPGFTKYCQCPDETPEEEIAKFMEIKG